MPKVADRYLGIDPWAVIEEGVHPHRSRVSESIFSLGNEYMGVRGYFEEGYSGNSLPVSYFNGVYEEAAICHPQHFKGLATRRCFMVNAVDWLCVRIRVDDETLDLAHSAFTDFTRRLNLRSGTLERALVWHTASGKRLKLSFLRFLSMATPYLGCQRVTLEAVDFSGPVEVVVGLDFSPRCIHESSLSPSIHSIMAAELGRHRDAYRYSLHAARLDLDNYNRNTHEGLHTTSMAAAWLNVVYGFGGLRSDGDVLGFRPSIPRAWQSFGFRIRYRESILSARVDMETVALQVVDGPPVAVQVFGETVTVDRGGVELALPPDRRA